MRLPQFTAGASLYGSDNIYRPTGQSAHLSGRGVRPQLWARSVGIWGYRACLGCWICDWRGYCTCYYPCPTVQSLGELPM